MFLDITLCAPKENLLNLNFDYMKSAKEEIEKAKKDELFEYTIDIIQQNFYDEMMTNLNKVEDPDRYFN